MRLGRIGSRAGLALLGLILLAVLAGRWLGMVPGFGGRASYQGRSVGHWFPRWYFEFAWNETRQLHNCRTLAAAGPEVMPLLVAAARSSDSPGALRYVGFRDSMPSTVAHLLLPRYRGAPAIHYAVGEVLKPMVARAETLRAFTNHWEDFPDWTRSAALQWLAGAPEHPTIAEPLLFRLLDGSNQVIAAEAAVTLCRYPAFESPRLARMIAAMQTLPAARFDDGPGSLGGELATRFVEIGTNAAAAEPLLKQWLDAPSPRLRADAAIALAAVAPDRFSLTGLMGAGGSGPEANPFLTEALNLERVRRTRLRLPWQALVPVLLPVLGSPGLAAPGARAPVLAFLEELGPDAAASLPAVIPLLTDATSARGAGRVVARIGPIDPETVPQLVPALTNADSAPPLVLLLAAYGPAARFAVPALERLARGDAIMGGAGSSSATVLDSGEDTSTGRPLNSRQVAVSAQLAGRLGLAHVWPSPGDLVGRPDLTWSKHQFEPWPMASEGIRRPVESGTISVPFGSLDRIAAEALRRITRK